MVERGGKNRAVGDLVEFLGVVVVEEDEEAQSVFDDGERVFSGEGSHRAVVEDEEGDRRAAVDFVGELGLREVAVEGGVLRVISEDLGDVVASYGGSEGEERESEGEERECLRRRHDETVEFQCKCGEQRK